MEINTERMESALAEMVEDVEFGGYCESKIVIAGKDGVRVHLVVTNEIDDPVPSNPIVDL